MFSDAGLVLAMNFGLLGDSLCRFGGVTGTPKTKIGRILSVFIDFYLFIFYNMDLF